MCIAEKKLEGHVGEDKSIWISVVWCDGLCRI